MLAVSRFKEPRNGTFSGKSQNLMRIKNTLPVQCVSYLTNNPVRYVKNLSFPAGKIADVESHVFCLRPNLVLKSGE